MKINQSFYKFIFDYKTYITILYGGAGSSKSHSWTQKMVLKCTQSKRKYLVIRATQASLKDSCIALTKEILVDSGIPFSYNKQEATMHVGESEILFKGGDNPERLKSIFGVTDVVIEEATEISPDMFTQLMLRLRSDVPDLQVTIAFNPVSKQNWVYRYFFDKDSPDYFLDDLDFKILHSTYRDNAFLPPKYIKTLLSLRKSSPYYYTVYVEGAFGTLGKLVFEHGTYKIGKPQSIPKNGIHLVCGCDPGVVDKFAIELSMWWVDPLSNKRIIYTYKEFCESRCLNKNVAQWIKQNIPSNVIIWADNAGASQIQELQALGITNMRKNSKPPGSVVTRIDTMHSFDEIWIDPSCTNLLKDLTIWQWHKDKNTGLYTMEIERVVDGYHCDCSDAWTYALQGLESNITITKIKGYKGL